MTPDDARRRAAFDEWGQLTPGATVGRYVIRRAIAEGGLETVYEAVQEHTRRTVALKLIKPGFVSPSTIRRMEHEAQILGRLNHPGIPQIYEMGIHKAQEQEVPYLAMEYVTGGRPIIDYARSHKLGTGECLSLFATICNALHHAHVMGILHLGLNPLRILVDSSGQPKIMDFGVARAPDGDLEASILMSGIGPLLYKSPEECGGDFPDSRSEVYTLGVNLYELLTDQLPYDYSRAPAPEIVRIVREEPPIRPSSVCRTLRGDVEAIILKALEKDRDRRYQSVLDLEQDVRRYLAGKAINMPGRFGARLALDTLLAKICRVSKCRPDITQRTNR